MPPAFAASMFSQPASMLWRNTPQTQIACDLSWSGACLGRSLGQYWHARDLFARDSPGKPAAAPVLAARVRRVSFVNTLGRIIIRCVSLVLCELWPAQPRGRSVTHRMGWVGRPYARVCSDTSTWRADRLACIPAPGATVSDCTTNRQPLSPQTHHFCSQGLWSMYLTAAAA